MHSIPSHVKPARIAITGGIGSGKSTAASMFAARGAAVMDTDAVVHELLLNDDIRNEIARQLDLGEVVAGDQGRRELADLVFDDREKLLELERLLFPLVRDVVTRWMEKVEAANAPAAVVEVPMLFEAEMEPLFDCVVMITAPEDMRKKRLSGKIDQSDFERRASRQLAEHERRILCDFVFDNTGPKEKMDDFVDRVFDEMTVSGS